MSEITPQPSCPQCHQKILPSLSNRCMYCGVGLPAELHTSDDSRQAIIVRAEESNKLHDLAMEAKDKSKNKKNKRPTPPTLPLG